MSEKVKKKIKNTVFVTFGTFLLCLAVEMFIIPYNILSGGVAGLAVALKPFIHVNETLFANILTIGLLLFGGLVLGKSFFFETALSSFLYPVFTTLCAKYATVPVIDPAIASFYGGLLGGIGIGIVMTVGASTGGMDIPPLIIHKLTGTKISALVLITDMMTVLLGLIAYDLSSVLIGLISVFITSIAIEKVLSISEGATAKSVQIISIHWDEINDRINDELNRGTTVYDVHGGYQGTPRKVLLVVVSQKQYSALISIVDNIDPKAFVITTDAVDMHGEGFTYGFRI
ncbi:MAG: YitT family protein [Erysipelotrichia bacterium]|nr:YitT family protein [Erysipelotrichia bacterium]